MNPKAIASSLARVGAVLIMGLSACVVPLQAGAATSSSPTQEIIAHGYASVDAVRLYFFCSTAACKKDQTANAQKASTAMSYLEGEALALKPSKAPTSQRPAMKKLVSDIKSLYKVFKDYLTQTSSTEVERNTGIIYYESANVGSDIYLLSSAVNRTKVAFNDWVVGAVAVLYSMQVDTQLLSAKTATGDTIVAANEDLIQNAVALKKDANGPNKEFNSLLVDFATTQTKVSNAEDAILYKKKSTVTNKELKALIASLSAQYTKIVDLEKSLAK
jgi:hypothetical protein